MDFSNMNDKDLLELYNKEKASRQTSGSSKINPMNPLIQGKGLGGNIGDVLTRLGGGQPVDNDFQKLYATEAIKQQFEDPTVRQLREAEIAALSQPPPEGFVRVGKQTLADPNYVKPMDQAKLDEDERARQFQSESIRGKAEQNLSSIAEAKKGSKYFGMMGNLPSAVAPSTWIPGGGNYEERKMWENNINQLLSQKVVDLITEMKQASKTGATGFGSLTEKEGAVLREASTALSKDLPPEQALYYLNEMEKINKKILSGNASGNVMTESSGNLTDDEAYQEYLRAIGK